MYRSTRFLMADNPCLFALASVSWAALGVIVVQHSPEDPMSRGVLAWWLLLCGVSVVNLCGWRIAARAVARRRPTADPSLYLFQRRQLVLSAVYVLGCAFRSILPRADVQRIGLFDSWISSVMVGRSVATVAEMCFMAQWALLLNKIGKDTGSRPAVVISWFLVPIIAVAEMCSWYAVLTTAYIGNAIEESLWTLSAVLLLLSCVSLWSRSTAATRRFLGAAMVLGVAYVAFMCTVDVPMYVSRWLADEASGRQYLSISQGLHDVWARWVITYEWEQWRTEIPWMSLYFSVGVWSSIALIHLPRFERPEFET